MARGKRRDLERQIAVLVLKLARLTVPTLQVMPGDELHMLVVQLDQTVSFGDIQLTKGDILNAAS